MVNLIETWTSFVLIWRKSKWIEFEKFNERETIDGEIADTKSKRDVLRKANEAFDAEFKNCISQADKKLNIKSKILWKKKGKQT